jgi:hypothetical protein
MGMPRPPLLGLIESTSYFQVNFFRDRAVSVIHPYLGPVDTIGYFIGVKMAEA